jgi:hypothetical protein
MGFGLRKPNEFALVVISSVPVARLDDVQVMKEVEGAKTLFAKITRMSPEIAGMACDRTLRFSIMSDSGAGAYEVCRIIGGQIEWKPDKRSEPAPLQESTGHGLRRRDDGSR